MLTALKALLSRGVALATPRLPRILVVVGVAAFVLGGMYLAGKRAEREAEAAAQYQTARAAIEDTIRVVDTVIHHDTVRVAASITKATAARATLAAADSALEAAVDAKGPTTAETEVPLSLALPPVEACKSVVAADDSVYVAMTQLLADKEKAIAAQSSRADLAEQRLAIVSRQPLLGFKSGVVVGAGIVLVIVLVF